MDVGVASPNGREEKFARAGARTHAQHRPHTRSTFPPSKQELAGTLRCAAQPMPLLSLQSYLRPWPRIKAPHRLTPSTNSVVTYSKTGG
eukprot:1402737-Amphidinium_carterae.1